jgi:CheY-like chemotaxis protein
MDPMILVIEDNPYTRKVVKTALEARGWGVVVAETGQEGIEKMAEERPDLVLQDLMLPDIDGLELVKILRSLPGREDVPILAFSSFLTKLEAARNEPNSFQGYIAKPIEPSALVAIVSEELAKRSSTSPSAPAIP